MVNQLRANSFPKNLANLTEIEIGISGRCNAGCVDCERWSIIDNNNIFVNKNNPILNKIMDRQKIKETFAKCKKLESVLFIGTTGDPLSHPQLDLICQDLIEMYPKIKIIMHTNGSLGRKELWTNLAKMPNVRVEFAIDGLEDTNHIYRRNVKWESVIANVKHFISLGGYAEWKYVAFPHNRHQIPRARHMAKELGFDNFNLVSRHSPTIWMDNLILQEAQNKLPKKIHPDATNERVEYEQELQRTLDRFAQANGIIEPECASNFNKSEKPNKFLKSNTATKIFIEADGSVWPCCFVAVLEFYSNAVISNYWIDKKKYFDEKYGVGWNNLYNNPIEKILATELFPPYVTRGFKDLKTATVDEVIPACIINCGKCNFYDPIGSETDHSTEFFMHRD
jgi:MoaA/NifB/PqqE/SkfB family radical SAM enzyme